MSTVGSRNGPVSGRERAVREAVAAACADVTVEDGTVRAWEAHVDAVSAAALAALSAADDTAATDDLV